MNTSTPPHPITLLLCALGGEGGGLLTDWLVDAARRAGYPVQATSVPGVAQRTGATTYYLEVWPEPAATLGLHKPVFCLSPVPGELDAIVSTELLETSRQISQGMSDVARTVVISATNRALTTQERMHLGDGRADSAQLTQLVQAHSREHHLLDMGALAREAGTVVSAIMLGALAASGVLPFPRQTYEDAVRAGGTGVEASLRGFALAFDRVAAPRALQQQVQNLLSNSELSSPAPQAIEANLAQQFPPASHPILALALPRLVAYQHAAYAQRYQQRLLRLWQAEAPLDPTGPATTEAARWLALWMMFDDIIQVADLKSRASRMVRVRHEVKAGPDDLVQVFDHFKPGIPEIAGLLPPALARRLLAWDETRQRRGQAAWSMPLKVASHTLVGTLALRALAACKPLRPLGLRYAEEQAQIERWLDAVQQGLARHPALGLELARCGRLVKGYGATQERGKANLLHLITHLAQGPDAGAAAQAVAQAREAALKDEAGTALDALLRQQGAPARPVKEQPIRWVRRPSKQGLIKP